MRTTKPDAAAVDYSKAINRMLYNSPLHTLMGKVMLVVIAALVLYPSLRVWIGWLKPLATSWVLPTGLALGLIGSVPALIVLRYLDRRQTVSWTHYGGILLLAVLFTTAPAAYFNSISPMTLLTVGFNEEFWKVLPLLLLVFFAPTLVSGVRDGIVYGALGGLAFNAVEIGNYILRVSSHDSIDAFLFQLGRLGFGGVENHVIWSALVGAGIGMAVQSDKMRTKILAPLGAYLLAVLTHDFQDFMGGALLSVAAMYMVLALQGVDVINLDKSKVEKIAAASSGDVVRIESLMVNVVVLPIVLRMLWKSGDWERQLIRDELVDEARDIITAKEYEGVLAEKRFRLRSVPGYPVRIARSIRNTQNLLAFHKHYLKRRHRPVDTDPLLCYYRAELRRLRSTIAV
jgi:protease PrsW